VVLVCAWCRHFGQPTGIVRPVSSRRWWPVSHTAARAYNQAGLASHGVCPICRPLLAREWGIDLPAALPAQQVIAA
jgi:hypothetical protein